MQKIALIIKSKKAGVGLLILLVFIPFFLMGFGLLICYKSFGFSIAKITSCFTYDETSKIKPLSDIEKNYLVENVFPQKFYSLGSGRQYYIFISEDQQFILKFFKIRTHQRTGKFNVLSRFFYRMLGFKQEMKDQLISAKMLNNYKYVYELLREETAIVYLHLDKTYEFLAGVTLIDEKGKEHHLDLNSIEFIVQRRAQKFYDHLNALVKQAKDEDLAASIRSFFQLIAIRCEKGFTDQNLDLRHSFGFIDNIAVRFDCATLSYDPAIKYPSNFRNAVLESAEKLQEWAQDNYPEATLLIQEEAQKVINHSF